MPAAFPLGRPALFAFAAFLAFALPAGAREVQGVVAAVDPFGNVVTNIPASALAKAGFEPGDVLAFTVAGRGGRAAFVSDYADVDRQALLLRLDDLAGTAQLAVCFGCFAERFSVSRGDKVALSLAVKAGYLQEYRLRRLGLPAPSRSVAWGIAPSGAKAR